MRIEADLGQGHTGCARTEPIGSIVNGMRPDMRNEQRQALGEAAAQENLQSVVAGIGGRLQSINASELRIDGVERPALLDGADCSCHGLIDIPYPEQLGAFRSYIADLQHRALDDGLLDVKVVALYVGRSHLMVHAEES